MSYQIFCLIFIMILILPAASFSDDAQHCVQQDNKMNAGAMTYYYKNVCNTAIVFFYCTSGQKTLLSKRCGGNAEEGVELASNAYYTHAKPLKPNEVISARYSSYEYRACEGLSYGNYNRIFRSDTSGNGTCFKNSIQCLSGKKVRFKITKLRPELMKLKFTDGRRLTIVSRKKIAKDGSVSRFFDEKVLSDFACNGKVRKGSLHEISEMLKKQFEFTCDKKKSQCKHSSANQGTGVKG